MTTITSSLRCPGGGAGIDAVACARAGQGLARLEADTALETGFPHDFIADMQSFAFGDVAGQVDE